MTGQGTVGSVWVPAARWWTDDLPPLSGRQRFWFYSVLLALAVLSDGSPLRAVATYAGTDPAMRIPEPLIRSMGLADVDGSTLIAIRNTAFAAWICAAIGFVTRPAMLVTGLSVALLHGVSRGVMASDHRWYLATYVLLLLCFAAGDGGFSVDAWLRRRLGWWPNFAASRSRVLRSGFARKLVLLAAVHTLFSAGVAKLLEGGVAWADGVPIRTYMGVALDAMENLGLPRGRWPGLADFIWNRPWLCRGLAVATLVIELGAPLMLFLPRLRVPMLLAASGFHIGIWFTMIPSYWVQIWCYSLAVDWGAVAATFRSAVRRGGSTAPVPRPAPSGAPALWPLALGSALAGTLVVVAAVRIESWPLTHVPMYSSYFGDGRVSDVAISEFEEPASFSRLSRRCVEGDCPWASMIPTLARSDVRLRAGDDTRRVTSHVGYPNLRHWYKVLHRTVWACYAHPPGSPEERVAVRRAEAVLARVRAVLAYQGVWLPQYDAIELVYEFADGTEVVASIPAAPAG